MFVLMAVADDLLLVIVLFSTKSQHKQTSDTSLIDGSSSEMNVAGPVYTLAVNPNLLLNNELPSSVLTT